MMTSSRKVGVGHPALSYSGEQYSGSAQHGYVAYTVGTDGDYIEGDVSFLKAGYH